MAKKKVLCWNCDKFLGWKNNKRYIELKEGIIQEGRGYKKTLRSFCSKKCQKKYHSILDRFNKIKKRLKKLEDGRE